MISKQKNILCFSITLGIFGTLGFLIAFCSNSNADFLGALDLWRKTNQHPQDKDYAEQQAILAGINRKSLARDFYLPSISFNCSSGFNFDQRMGSREKLQSGNNLGCLIRGQLSYSFQKIFEYRKASTQERFATLDRDYKEMSLVYHFLITYLQLAEIRSKLDSIDQAIKLIFSNVLTKLEQIQDEAMTLSQKQDFVSQLETFAVGLKNEKSEIEVAYALALIAVQELVGPLEPIDGIYAFDKNKDYKYLALTDPEFEYQYPETLERAKTKHPEVRLKEILLDLALMDVSIEKSKWAPVITLSAGAEHVKRFNFLPEMGSERDVTQFGGGLGVAIPFDQILRQKGVEEARVREKIASFDIIKAKTSIQVRVQTNFKKIELSHKNILTAHSDHDAQRTTYEKQLAKLTSVAAVKENLSRVTDAMSAVRAARTQTIAAKIEYLKSKFELSLLRAELKETAIDEMDSKLLKH